jgi:hypothetical protein
MPNIEHGNAGRHSKPLTERILDFPVGVFVFLLVLVGGFVWTLTSAELKAGDYLTAVGGGAGLLAVGHGIRTHGQRARDRG